MYPRDDAHLATVLDETRVLSTLIEDLRTLALAETGALVLHREPTDLGVLVHDVVAAFEPTALAARVILDVACAPSLPSLDVDSHRIRQVLTNLVTNAMQHTPPGGSVRVTCDGQEPGRVVVSVVDTGAGIAADDPPHVFDRFYKPKTSRGSGLGLAIARQLAAHGGDISATSEVGRGTTLRFTLPAQD